MYLFISQQMFHFLPFKSTNSDWDQLEEFFFQFQNFFSKTLFWVLFSGQNSSVQQWVWLGIDSYLVMFFSFFLDSEPESEDSYYGTPRNNNNKRRKSRGILKTTPSEYVFTFACIYSCLYEVSSYSTHHSRLTERFSFQSYLMLSCKNVALSQSPPPQKKRKIQIKNNWRGLHYCSYLMLYFSILLMIVIKYF